MESPLNLSRSSSFAPGSHRRSHPNLQHLSLVPLTPKYPIDPADYSAYVDPSTSELHTSASISHIASLPSPGGILSRASGTASLAHSRANSRTRLSQNARKKNKSFVTIQAPHSLSGPNTSGSLGQAKGSRSNDLSLQQTHSASDYSAGGSLHKADSDSWFIQTGLTLTEGSRESKGQSWISKRDSSIALATLIDERPSIPAGAMRSGRNTPGNLSRRNSFQRRSRRSLAMTPAPSSTPPTSLTESAAPDWADDQTQAELAAQNHEDFGDELDEDGDPYGVLDFEGQFDSEDEDELRESIKGYRLGAWMDGLVDVFLRLEDDFPGSQVDATRARTRSAVQLASDSDAAPTAAKDTEASTGSGVRFDDSVESPPEQPKSVWDDVAWFGRMVARTVQS